MFLITMHLCRILLQIGGSRWSPEIVVTKMQGISFGYSAPFQFSSVTHSFLTLHYHSFGSVQSLSHVQLFATPWTTAHQAFLSITYSRTLPKPMSNESVMPSNHLILCHPLLFLPSIFPSIRVFSNESVLHIWWPKYWNFSFSISSSNEYSGLIPLRWTGWISLQSKGLSGVFSNTTVRKHQFFSAQLSS